MNENKNAFVTLSFDFEIGWGDITNPNWRRRQANGVYKRLREVLPEILKEMDALEIPATWAAVGAMFDDPKRRELDHLPPNASTVIRAVLKEAEPESFNGRDLFELVAKARAQHAFASHSYSHLPFSYAGVDADFVRSDLRAFKRALSETGHQTDRFVFPENIEGYGNVLKDEGFRVVRVAANTYFKNRWLYLASIAVIPPPPVRVETDCHGLERVYGSMLFNDAGQKARVPLLKRRVALGLRSAIRNKTGLHIWSHPFNYAESSALKDAFLTTLRQLAHHRDRGEITIRTM
jgi:Polysaccharide deacetylase